MEQQEQPDIEFDDFLVKLFLMLHRCKYLQWLVLLVIRIRDKLDSYTFINIKKPITKEVDEMDNCHFRTLYGRQPCEDNYTDPDFLCSMQLNTNLNYYSIGEAVLATTRISLYVSPCVLYIIVYYHLGRDNISPEAVIFISILCTAIGYFSFQAWRLWGERPWTMEMLTAKVPVLDDGKVFVCCGSVTYLLIPILRTITNSMDLPTVHAVSVAMFGVHLLSNDYGLRMPGIVSKPLSMNSAIFSMVCLASRMQSDEHCLALMAFGAVAFICFPQVKQMLWRWPTGAALLMLVTTISSFTVSLGMAFCFFVAMFIIIIVAPSLYIYHIQYKVNILGPWDEAILDLNVNMEEIEKGFSKRKMRQPPSSSSSCSGGGHHPSESRTESRGENDDEAEIAEMEAKGIGQVL